MHEVLQRRQVNFTCVTPAAATSSSSSDMVALLSAANADTLHATHAPRLQA